MDFLQIPERTKRSREYGITSIVDFGIPIGELSHILNDYHSMVDFAKIGIGTAYVTPNLDQKITMYKQFGIKPYCGGTFFEKCYHERKFDDYLSFLKKIGVDWIEISNGTISIPLNERLNLVKELSRDFYVLGEVGSKDPSNDMSIEGWQEELSAFLDAGCCYVITEGRTSGSSGIYTEDGKIKLDLIHEVVKNLDLKKVIFEAPKPAHQIYFINQFGANVNLGNVDIHDVVLLESQRCGLRSETFFSFENGKHMIQER